jgi:putative acetyltransferase
MNITEHYDIGNLQGFVMGIGSIVIRPVKRNDATALNRLRTSIGVVKFIHSLPAETDQETENFFFNADEKAYTFIAEEQEHCTVIGYIRLVIDSEPRKRHTGRLSMAVIDHAQGCGVGGKLLDEMINLAKNWLGISKLLLQVMVSNERAVRLYKSRHFETEGLLKNDFLVDGLLEDSYIMAKFI